jgi:Tfp pilus assembly protein PilX
MGKRLTSPRGAATLIIVLITALLAGIAAYSVLQMMIAEARQARFYRERMRARYAAEAGIVWAQQRLWDNEAWSSGVGTDFTLPDGTTVDVVMAPCGASCFPRDITSEVTW